MIFRSKTASRTACALLALMPFAAVPALAGDLEASAGVASSYLFRGVDVSAGHAQVFGDLTYRSDVGVYLSGWGSSAGDGTNEVDTVLGFSHDIGPVAVNIGAINYVYPGDSESDDFGAESEGFVGLSWNGFELYYYGNVSSKREDNEGYYYVAASYVWKQFAVTFGYAADDTVPGGADDTVWHDGALQAIDDGKYNYMHVDVTYAFNDNLSFTVSQIVDRDVELTTVGGDKVDVSGSRMKNLNEEQYSAVADDSLMFVLTYSLPLEF